MAEFKPVQLADLSTIEPNQFYEIGGNTYISDDKGILVEVGSIIANSPELIEAISPQGSPQQMDVTNDIVPVPSPMTTNYTMSAPGTSQPQNIIQSAMAQSQLPVTVNNPDIQTDFFDENDIATDDAQPIAQIMRGLKQGQNIGKCADLNALIQCFFVVVKTRLKSV